MKRIFLPIIFFTFLTNIAYQQTSSSIIIGRIIETEGEYVFLEIDKNKKIALGMIFGIYNSENEAVGVCEISKIDKNNNYIARILTQTEEIKKDYTALADIEKEYKLREKIKDLKTSANYLDSYKKFEASLNKPINMTNSDTPAIKDKILCKIFNQSLTYVGLQIYKFSNPLMTEKEETEITPLNIYRDIIDESSKLKIDNVNNKVNMEASINIGKLKRRLQSNGFTLKPKIVRLVFPTENNAEVIKQIIDKILKYSNYASTENEDIKDITSPVSFIIYTTPKIFADEINTFDFEDIRITPSKVYEDTIELKTW
ncbi:MAG: hypothetical protein PHX78_06395 [bacterium]|nr:hypothetical protein [bacterium]